MQETKGQATKNHILKEGLLLASVNGLVNISIGGLASKANMSRSGLFAHFLSKEQLQLEILEYAANLFEETIVQPTREIADPIEKLHYLIENFPNWYERTDPKIPGGCIFLMACMEFDDRPGKVRDYLLDQQSQFLGFLKSIYTDGINMGLFTGQMTADHFGFVFYSFYMGYNQYKKFFGNENAKKHANRNLIGLVEYAKTTPLSSHLS